MAMELRVPDHGFSVVGVGGTPTSGPTILLPVGQTVRINLTAADVIHSFFVPDFNFKRDAIPGVTNVFDLTIPRAGVFRGECAELCGVDHSDMTFYIRAVSPAEFQAWVQHNANAGVIQEGRPVSTSTASQRGTSGPKLTRLLDWITTTNHKTIGLLYIGASLIFFLAGGLMAELIPNRAGHAGAQRVVETDLQRAVHDPRHDDDLPVSSRPSALASRTISCHCRSAHRIMAFPRMKRAVRVAVHPGRPDDHVVVRRLARRRGGRLDGVRAPVRDGGEAPGRAWTCGSWGCC